MNDFESIVKSNAESLRIFRELLARCTDDDLATAMPAGWTVSSVLCHLTFWDQRALTLLDKWEKDGVDYSAIDTDVVNEITRHLCLRIPPREAVDLFLRTAEVLDGRVSRLDSSFIHEIEDKGKNVHLNRAKHREMHLADIKNVLKIE